MSEIIEPRGKVSILFSVILSLFTDKSPPSNTIPGLLSAISMMVSYTGDFTGTFTAELEYEDSGWRLDSINLNAAPDKFGPRNSSNG
jgi:hypothetical protein